VHKSIKEMDCGLIYKKARVFLVKLSRISRDIQITFQLEKQWNWSMGPADQWVHGVVHLAHTPSEAF
jgi:hypothetical protein